MGPLVNACFLPFQHSLEHDRSEYRSSVVRQASQPSLVRNVRFTPKEPKWGFVFTRQLRARSLNGVGEANVGLHFCVMLARVQWNILFF